MGDNIMSRRDIIKSIIIKSLESANADELAQVYNEIVSCADCPYRHKCGFTYDCHSYIFDKLIEREVL